MKKYFLNKRSLFNGFFPVHKEGCPFLPDEKNRTYIGSFKTCYGAVEAAEKININSDGCYFCIKNCSKYKCENLQFWKNPKNLKVIFSEN